MALRLAFKEVRAMICHQSFVSQSSQDIVVNFCAHSRISSSSRELAKKIVGDRSRQRLIVLHHGGDLVAIRANAERPQGNPVDKHFAAGRLQQAEQ
jgi:hypothetical protein